jgi:SAM-dependent methyltransferase
MALLDRFHGGYVHPRRVQVLAKQVAALLPQGATVLDIGCGDGLLAAEVRRMRSDVTLSGIDVLVRPSAHIDVTGFDGQRIPFADNHFQAVLLIDVLHHTADPSVLLKEARRVAREVIVKDHTKDSVFAGPILRFMDRVGNERHGVESIFNYWPTSRWQATFAELQLNVTDWISDPPLYQWPASLIFGRRLHFVAKLARG